MVLLPFDPYFCSFLFLAFAPENEWSLDISFHKKSHNF